MSQDVFLYTRYVPSILSSVLWWDKAGDPKRRLDLLPRRTLRGVRNGVEEQFGGSILVCGVISEDKGDFLFCVSS